MDNVLIVKTILFAIWVVSIIFVTISIFGMIIMALISEKKVVHVKKKSPFYSLEQIESMVKDKTTDEAKMQIIVRSFVEHHQIPPKERGKPNKQAKYMLEMIFTFSGHTKMTDEMRHNMFQDLIAKNPEYKEEFKNAG